MSEAPARALSRWICSRQASIVFLLVALLAVLGLSMYPRPEELLGRMSLYDKAGHFAAYCLLGFLALRAAHRMDAVPIVLTFASCAALGGLIEVIQPLVGRRRELGDFLVDLAGAALGVALSAAVAALLSRRAQG
jgi:VanZ family protein